MAYLYVPDASQTQSLPLDANDFNLQVRPHYSATSLQDQHQLIMLTLAIMICIIIVLDIKDMLHIIQIVIIILLF